MDEFCHYIPSDIYFRGRIILICKESEKIVHLGTEVISLEQYRRQGPILTTLL